MRPTLLLLAAAVVSGCLETTSAPPARAVPAPASTPAGAAASGPVTAPAETAVGAAVIVNGQPIPMSELDSLLLKAHGMEFVQQLVATEIVRQEARRSGIAVTEADIKTEHDATLAQMFPMLTQQEQRDRMLDQWLRGRNLPPELWDLTMRRNAMLAKLAQARVKITDDALKAEFLRQYGRRVRIRHIETDSLEKAEAVLTELYQGAEFDKLARTRSLNPSGAESGGLLPPMGENEPNVPPPILQAALALKKVGDISNPVKYLDRYHILKLEEIIEPSNVKFDDVRAAIAQSLRARQVVELKQQILLDLIQQADRAGKIEYVDPILKRLNADAVKAGQDKNP